MQKLAVRPALAEPTLGASLACDAEAASAYAAEIDAALRSLGPKAERSAEKRAEAETLKASGRAVKERFFRRHAVAIYDEITGHGARMLRVSELAAAVAARHPALLPTPERLKDERALTQQSAKEGYEVDQGLFLAHVLARPRIGEHLCHAMLLPRPESAALAVEFASRGALDLGAARLTKRGKAVHLEMINPRFLNAEDDTTLSMTELAVDVATLDRTTDIAVMRGVQVDNEKYRGRRIFGAGINLTHLYLGKIPFLWFLIRDLGYVHKLLRGVASPESLPDDVNGRGVEKLWIAAVDAFAIGGHCQALLVMDYVLAASDAFLTLPARKEGIIPGFANLRMPRFTGDRIARQAVLYERRLDCDSAEGRMICDEIAPAAEMDQAIDRVVAGLTSAGAISAIGNRRAFRVGQEPLDLFRRYASVYAREQAYCHFSPALIANLERNWDAKNRKV